MAADKKQPSPQDRARISMSEDDEVRYWAETLGVTKEEGQRAVNQVGNGAGTMRGFVKKQARRRQDVS